MILAKISCISNKSNDTTKFMEKETNQITAIYTKKKRGVSI
jgi:hypothetical protein